MGGGDWVNKAQQPIYIPPHPHEVEPEVCDSIVCALREFDFSTIALVLVGVAIVTTAKVLIERYLKHRKE